MKISPDLIPHSEFHTCTWLRSMERPSWYYFSRKQNDNHITSRDFIKSVDEPLRGLVEFLHKKGIKTTPSCSGHHISERNLEKIYHELEEDSFLINTSGLTMEEVETGRHYLFRDKNYVLPWDKENFIEKVEVYQQKGVIGLHVGNRRKIKKAMLNLDIPGVRTGERDSILFIFTGEKSDLNIEVTWKEITRQVKMILRDSQLPPPERNSPSAGMLFASINRILK